MAIGVGDPDVNGANSIELASMSTFSTPNTFFTVTVSETLLKVAVASYRNLYVFGVPAVMDVLVTTKTPFSAPLLAPLTLTRSPATSLKSVVLLASIRAEGADPASANVTPVMAVPGAGRFKNTALT